MSIFNLVSEWRRKLKQSKFQKEKKHKSLNPSLYKNDISNIQEDDDALYDSEYIAVYYEDAGIHMLDIAKDIIDTFKPYKTNEHRNRDLYKIYDGVLNISIGITIHFPMSVFLFFYALIYLIVKNMHPCKQEEEKIRENFNLSFKCLALASSELIRGASQLIITIFIPFRIIYRDSLATKDQCNTLNQKFTQRKSILLLVDEYCKITRKLQEELGDVASSDQGEKTPEVHANMGEDQNQHSLTPLINELIRKGEQSQYKPQIRNNNIISFPWHAKISVLNSKKDKINSTNNPLISQSYIPNNEEFINLFK